MKDLAGALKVLMSRWSERLKYSWEIMACVKVVFQLHFLDTAGLCILHADASSNKVITRSTRWNSPGFVRASLKLSQ